ncbi:MAG: hypothetical protein KKI09_10585 [Spirochaetes bacterium]|nr:hypothetical protein [Spirochaetota bacterium]MBU0955864.1 hypothetical protein [Spirochaetota bacterium]
MKKIVTILVLAAVVLSLSGCMPGDGKNTAEKPAGFFWGAWHGIIAPVSLIVGIFNRSIRVYEVHNSGWWYDLGFWLLITGTIGGGSASASRRRRKK